VPHRNLKGLGLSEILSALSYLFVVLWVWVLFYEVPDTPPLLIVGANLIVFAACVLNEIVAA
jgi:hypothetical protein